LLTSSHKNQAFYALEGSIAISGALVQWLRDNLGLIKIVIRELKIWQESVDDNGGIYFVPGFQVYLHHIGDPTPGVIAGLTRYVTKGHLARAALEATAYQTREVLEAMEKDAGVTLSILKADGGMVYNELLMQFQADILNVPVVRPRISETTALGAAYAAGLATGFWQNIEDIRQNWKMDKIWYPQMDPEIREMLFQGWKKALERALNWVE
jgi:glycerol kinase